MKKLVLLSVVIFALLFNLSKIKLPQIVLPKMAQHNTIGELPIVEMADDGVFAEVDGFESLRFNGVECLKNNNADFCYRECRDWIDAMCGSSGCNINRNKVCLEATHGKGGILDYPITGIIKFL